MRARGCLGVCVGLNFLRVKAFLWRHLFSISDLLFKSPARLVFFNMWNFSDTHSLHVLDLPLYGLAFSTIDHLIVCGMDLLLR